MSPESLQILSPLLVADVHARAVVGRGNGRALLPPFGGWESLSGGAPGLGAVRMGEIIRSCANSRLAWCPTSNLSRVRFFPGKIRGGGAC